MTKADDRFGISFDFGISLDYVLHHHNAKGSAYIFARRC